MTGRIDFELMPEELPPRARRVLDAAFRAIRSVLDGTQGGIHLREQFRGIVDCTIDTAALPVGVKVPLKSPPLEVRLLRATVQRTSTGQAISGARVTWEWRAGSLLIHAVDGLAATTRYDATIAVME